MLYTIRSTQKLSATVTRMVVDAPHVVRHAQPGQFVVVIPDARGERIPLTIADMDRAAGCLTLIFQEAGFSTKCLAQKKVGDVLASVLGPLGHPTQIEKYGQVIGVGGGVGIAEIWPVLKALKGAGNHVVGIIGARTKELLILEDELRGICDEVLAATNDGSHGTKGFVTDILQERLCQGPVGLVYAVGPVPMMKKIAQVTLPSKTKTIVSLNPLMVDATGMCGVCRCRVAGKTVFGCVDGPEFNAHEVDFEALEKRLKTFENEERASGYGTH